MLACSFLIESSSKLLVTRTGTKARSNSILGRIRPLILELLALEWQKFHTFELEYLWSQLVNLDQILCVASLGWGKGCIRFWGRLTWHIGLRWAIVALWATCFLKSSMDFVHLWRGDRALSKILRSTIPIPVHGLKVKVTELFVFNFCSVSFCKAFDWFESCLVWINIRC